jgi:uncharacterized protein YlxW (UPF0749 family)
MKLGESKLLLLAASIILGFILSSQLSYLKPLISEIPTLRDYQQTVSGITKSRDEVRVLNEKKRLLESKLHDYENSSSLEAEVAKKLEAELINADLYACLTDVKGPGVVISLSDNTIEAAAARTVEEIEDYNVHDLDIINLVWALKNGGAEAVSVNDQRILYSTGFYCVGPAILINRVKTVPPYTIKAIGNPEALVKAVEDNPTYIELKEWGFQLKMAKDNNIMILKSDKY